jgi:IS5 family transposase
MRQFAGVRTDADVIPDETSILNFRRLLEKHQLTEHLCAAINAHLSERGLIVGKGTIVDAAIINAPSSTKNAEQKRDPEMHQTQKGKQRYFGMKVHIGTGTDSGLVHTVRATAANVADVNMLGELLHGNEDSLHADSAYHSKALKAEAFQPLLTLVMLTVRAMAPHTRPLAVHTSTVKKSLAASPSPMCHVSARVERPNSVESR